MEKLDRGLVAVRVNANSVYVGWRMFGTDPQSISFNVYRGGVKVNATPITTSTNYTDTTTANSTYTVRPVIGGVEQTDSETAAVWPQFYMTIPMTPPDMETMPDGVTCTYSANDCSVGDLDGDGKYEIVVKWDPTNSKDNSQSGYTGDVFLDAYKLNGTRLWRIDLGPNIRAGAHYTQFMVFDLDSDGKAEVVCKTAPGTKDSSGNYLSTGPAASDNDATDYRNTSGYILSGPEYLTVFNGSTGREMATVNYNPPRGTVSAWGDNYGNRVDRFLACVAYLDGVHPSVVMCRGYYTRTTLAAWDWDGTKLTQRWFWDSDTAGAPYAAHALGLGNHNLSVADVNGDGFDEIIYGPIAIDHNGKAMYDTMLGHGDAMHLGKLLPDRPGLQVWDIHENYPEANGGGELHDAATGEIIWGIPNTGDTGRGLAADIDPNYRGYEMWSPMTAGVDDENGNQISVNEPSTNFRIYWDGDLQDELLDGTKMDKWTGNGTSRLLTIYNYAGATANNGTKNTPGLTADILGDWREEMIYRNADSTGLTIFTTTTMTNYRFYTLMHDFEYRDSIAWQNVAYNQPPHLDFYLGDGPSAQPVEAIIYPGTTPSATYTNSPAVTPASTSTRTFTPTFTSTFTRASTATGTPTVTPTFTPTATRTVPPTASQTWTAMINTATKTPAFTGSATATLTAVYASPTSTRTSTVPDTYTATGTMTSTAAKTSTPSYTSTSSISPTQTCTATSTSTMFTPTYSVTFTSTLTVTDTPAESRTPTFTITVTATDIPAGYTELQAENACSYDGVFETIHTGYTGTGYTNLDNTTGSSVMFFVDSASAQALTFTYRYANASANSRDMYIMVNEVTQPATLYFPTTGSWDAWQDSSVTVNLSSGRNEITIIALTAEGGPNLDRISYISTSVAPASCVPPQTPTQIETDTPPETQVPTLTITPAFTATATDMPGLTATSSATPTLTLTMTVTPADSATQTVTVAISTSTQTPGATPEIRDPVVYPNPYVPVKSGLSIELGTDSIYKEIDFRLYTAAFRLVLEVKNTGSYTGNIKLDVPAGKLSNLASGTYFYSVYAVTQNNGRKKILTGILTVLK
jgi:rhamnogalacturonan endolyase